MTYEIKGQITLFEGYKNSQSPFFQLRVVIQARGPAVDKKIAEFGVGEKGEFAGEVPTSEYTTLQAKLYRGKSNKILTISDIVRVENQRVEFQLTLEKPKASGSLYTRLDTIFSKIDTPFPEDEAERVLWYGVTDEPKDDVRRYYNAHELARQCAEQADREVWDFYQDYETSLVKFPKEKAIANARMYKAGELRDMPRLPEIIFGLLLGRPRIPQSIALLAYSRDALSKRISVAKKAKDIGKFSKDGISNILDCLICLRDGLHMSYTEDAHPMGALVLLADPKISVVSELLDYLLEGKPLRDPEGKNKPILKIISKDTHARLMCVQDLVVASENYSLMVGWFMAKQMQGRQNKPLRPGLGRNFDPVKLRETASKYKPEQWARLAKVSGVPDQHKTSENPEQDYAGHVTVGLMGKMPREALLTQLKASKSKILAPAAKVLRKYPDFDMREEAVDSYFSKTAKISKTERESLKTLARLNRIVPMSPKTIEHVAKIAEAGFSSARDIIGAGKIEFTESLREKIPNHAIKKIFCKARFTADVVGELQIQLVQQGVASVFDFEQTITGVQSAATEGDVEPPTFAAMFGSLDSCACTACQSVHSPAAYLHNLLHWMKSDVCEAYPRLLTKRPDIPKLLLNCTNTHTVLPYIDLVNEALSWTLDGTEAPIETKWTEDALRLQPEYRYTGAEAQIQQPNFPLDLPYHRSSAEGRAALSSAGETTAEIMATFLSADRATWAGDVSAAYRAARLDMDPAIYDLLVNTSPPSNFWQNYTGVNSAPGRNVGKIMAALGLGFEEMDALIRLDFIASDDSNGESFWVDEIAYADATCSYAAATYKPVESHNNNFSAFVCWRALRLLRLSSHTARSTAELSRLLMRFSIVNGSAYEINDAFLAFLSATNEIETQCDVKLEQTLSYFELPYSNGSDDRYAAFAKLYTTRTYKEVKLAEKILGFANLNLTQAKDIAAFMVKAAPLFENVTDLFALRSAPFADQTGSQVDIKATVPAALFVKFNAAVYEAVNNAGLVAGDLIALEALLFETISVYSGVPLAVCQGVYVSRADEWTIDFDDNVPSDLSDVAGLEDYANDLWGEGHHVWMHDMLVACDVSQDMIDIATAKFEPHYPDVVPDYLELPVNFSEHLWMLRDLASRYDVTELELSGPLILGDSDLIPGWLLDAVTHTGMSFPDDVGRPQFMERCLHLQSSANTLGVIEERLSRIFKDINDLAWATPALDGNDYNLAAEIFRQASSNASKRNRDVFEKGADKLRKDLRDALLALLITEDNHLNDEEDVYRLLLLDPAMQPCMMTSRLKLATSSVQLLMHRAMMNLEGGDIEVDEDDKEQWKWRSAFRVWEANTKILLYPENWIEPSLRLNPTPLFEQSVALLFQDELTEKTTEAAIYDYLSGLDKTARLDIRATYKDRDVLHVFGRNWVAPYEHYYRRNEAGIWTHWEKVDVDIEADNIIPVVFHRRLWLLWPIIIDKKKTFTNFQDPQVTYKEIKLAYTTYEYGKWRGKKILGKSVLAGPRAGRDMALNLDLKTGNRGSDVGLEPEDFLFIADLSDDESELRIMVRRVYNRFSDENHLGYTAMCFEDGWVINGCNSDGEIVPAGYTIPQNWEDNIVARPYMTVPYGQNMIRGYDGYKGLAEAGLYVKTSELRIDVPTPILAKAPAKYTLTYPQQKHALWDKPFFMMDDQHTHFYEREIVCVETDVGQSMTPPIDKVVHFIELDDQYKVSLHEHPYACQMIATFNQFGVDGIYGRGNDDDGLKRQALVNRKHFGNMSEANYKPSPYRMIKRPFPVFDFNFDQGSAYGVYNWELFFHMPTLIARQLKSDGRHSEAIRWLSMVFDPTSREADLGARRVWRIKPFMTADSRSNIATLVRLLGQVPSNAADRKVRKSFEAQLKAWQKTPFEPHRIAEHRLSAYMMWAALEYVDILIEWGDALFKQDSIESINEATNLYMLADAILGKRPTTVEKGSVANPKSFESLYEAPPANELVSDWVSDLESWVTPSSATNECQPQGCHSSVFGALSPRNYFCIPPNPKLPEYWDRIAGRLSQIRYCRNLSGDQRSLALFQPPIDPAMLVKARAAGLSISDVIAGLSEVGLGYRFQFLLQKSQDFTAEVKAFGGQLLSALEKRDGEELSLIRQTHEMNIQKATRNLKKMSLAEAKENLVALQHSRESAQISYDYYTSREFRNSKELKSKDLTYASDAFMITEQVGMLAAGFMGTLPDAQVGPMPLVYTIGGKKISDNGRTIAMAYGVLGSLSRSGSARASTLGSFERRRDDWVNQAATTQKRLNELDRQIVAAEIRLQTAEKDIEIFEMQMTQSEDIRDYMKSKFTGEKLYTWMANTLKTSHRQAFELAANMARQAQLAANRELRAESSLSFITADQWDSSRAGLLAGERLSIQLKQLDNAYWKEKDRLNVYEMTRTISLRRLDPAALYSLKARSKDPVPFRLPKWLFQSTHHGTSLRDMRIHSVAVSLPCTTGPNAKVDLKLILTSGGRMAAKKSIITSTAQSDTGRFDPNPNGNSYLPFENADVESEWTITLPDRLEFDPITINDVILTIRYSGVPGKTESQDSPSTAASIKGKFALSLRHDFYDSWFEAHTQTSRFNPEAVFPIAGDAIFMERVPYIYENGTCTYDMESTFVLTRNDDGTMEVISQVSGPNVLSVEDGLITLNGKEVVDIIAIVDVA